MWHSAKRYGVFAKKIINALFYYAKSAHYESATLSEISLIPAEHILSALKSDYAAMKNMIYGEYPGFEEILDCLKALEKEVHILDSK